MDQVAAADLSDYEINADQVAQNAPEAAPESAFSSAEEAARQSSNPLGGDFWIPLN